MKIGDLIVDSDGQLGLILTEPRLSEDCEPGGEAYPNEEYYLMDVQFATWIESVATDEVELINELSSR
tara:strand:+ start:588 stop:791 length:204 start_codon:yes stop_codon:yes gene_type:complete